MDKATQQNAALVEESAAAAEGLQAQAQQMVQAVAVFKLNAAAAGIEPMATVASLATKHKVVLPERRGPSRATNVTRPDFKAHSAPGTLSQAAPAKKTGTDDDWTDF
jgi:methyl-accepting chemotaxis protein